MKKLIIVLVGAIFLMQSCDITAKKELQQCNKEKDSLIKTCKSQERPIDAMAFPWYYHDITERQAEVLINDCIDVYRYKLTKYGVSGFIDKSKVYGTSSDYEGVNVYFGINDGGNLSLYYQRGNYVEKDMPPTGQYYVASDIKKLTSTTSDQKFSTLKGLPYSYVSNSLVDYTKVVSAIAEFKAQFPKQNTKDQMFINQHDIDNVFDSIPAAIGLRFFIGFDSTEHDNRLRVIMFPQDSTHLNYLSPYNYRMILERMWP